MIILGNILLFGRTVPLFFVSDDFAQIEWGVGGSVWRLFISHGQLYRPIQSLAYRVLYSLFGLSPVPYHVLNILLHTLNSLLVMVLVLRLTKSRPAALLCAGTFSLHFMHVEPVIWISSLNILLTTCFILCGLLLLRWKYPIGLALSLVFALLALLSKETGLVMPLLVLLLLIIESHQSKQSFRMSIPHFLLGLAYCLWRIPVLAALRPHGAYGFGFGANALKNLSFLTTSMFFRLNYAELLATWNAYGKGLNAVAGLIRVHPLTLVLVCLSCAGLAVMVWRGDRIARFGGIFMLCAALPMIFMTGTGERLTYLPSVGFAVILGVSILRLKKPYHAVVGALVCLYLFTLAYLDSERWIVASGISRQVMDQLRLTIGENPRVERIHIRGLPDNYMGAYLFRGDIGSGARLISGEAVEVIKTDESVISSSTGTDIYLEYRDGQLLEARAKAPGP